MRSLWLTVGLLFAGASSTFAAEHEKHDHSTMAAAAKTTGGPTLVQKTCPVTGKPVREDLFVEQDGLKVYFCCPNCPSRFKAAPTKYLPAVYKQIYAQSVQLKCPVMGGPIDGQTFIEYQGRRIDFCCDACPKDFKADPAKFLAKLEQVSTRQVHCPVTGKAIDPKLSSEYEGKVAYFSSADALARFKAGPAKYAAALRPEAGLLARGATAEDDLFLTLTPGGAAEIGKWKDLKPAVYEGKTYLLRGDDGLKSFQANPAKYAKALDVEMKKRSTTDKAPVSDASHDSASHGQGGGAGHSGHPH
jgi:YHS domain-containing protein